MRPAVIDAKITNMTRSYSSPPRRRGSTGPHIVANGHRQRPTANLAVLRAALLLAVALVALAACGKKASPTPPGPADQITYPRIYPAY